MLCSSDYPNSNLYKVTLILKTGLKRANIILKYTLTNTFWALRLFTYTII